MVKIISFDLDGTLIKNTYANVIWLEGLPRLYAKERNLRFKEARKIILSEYNKVGSFRYEWYDLEYWFKLFNIKSRWKDLLLRYKEVIEPFPEVFRVLSNLQREYLLVISSNAKKEFIEIEIKKSNIKQFFNYIFSSISDYNKIKKYPDFYTMICNKLNIKPEEMIHIGDNKKFDYIIPKSIGINAYYLNRKKKLKSDYVVNDLLRFQKIVNSIYTPSGK
jgi:putative hydrolase of the HAD superfamily